MDSEWEFLRNAQGKIVMLLIKHVDDSKLAGPRTL